MSGALFSVPLILFMLFVAPLWLLLHYRSKRKAADGLSDDDLQALHALSSKAERLQNRVETLEKILDAEAPRWRKSYD
jgi:phage shock protein B